MSVSTLVFERLPRGWMGHRETGSPLPLSGPAETASLAEVQDFIQRIANSLACALNHCAVIVDGGAEPVSTLENAGALLLTRTLALAHLLADAPERLAVVDLCGRTAVRLVSQRAGLVTEESLASTDPLRVAEVLRMLGISRVLICRGERQPQADAEAYVAACDPAVRAEVVADDDAHIRGAEAALTRRRERSGVRRLGPGHLEIRFERTTRYDLYRPIGPVFSPGEDTLAKIAGGRPVFFIVDRRVDAFYGQGLRAYGREHLAVAGEFLCGAAEADKTLRTVEEICRAAYAAGLPRDGILVAVGGGVTLDLAGFSASVFRRGVAFVRIPTTLIGLVDVAVGVKQASNAFGAKNLLGSFYPPLACVLDYRFLRTLPPSGLSDGFAEILKMALIGDETLLVDVERYGRLLIDSGYQVPAAAGERIAARAEVLMAEELAPNLFEHDLQRHVDFGHTFSPALETRSQFRISHGEAVALDMLLSTAIAVRRGICEPDLLPRLLRVTAELKLPCWRPEMRDTAGLNEALTAAWRHRGGSLNLVVPTRAGAVTFLQSVSMTELGSAAADLEHVAGSGATTAPTERGLQVREPASVKEGRAHASVGL